MVSLIVDDTRLPGWQAPAGVAEPDGWTVVGQPLRDLELRHRVVGTLVEVAAVTGWMPQRFEERDYGSVFLALDDGHERLLEKASGASGRDAARRVTDLLVDVARTRGAVVDARAQQLRARYGAVRTALAKLQGVGTVSAMLQAAPEALCRCGFDRAVVSRVADSTWWVENVHVAGDPAWAAEIVRVAREHPRQLTHMLRETEMMRRRRPMVVTNAQADPHTNPEIGRVSKSRSYVAAPIMPDGRIVGFLHADSYMGRQHIDEEDAAVLWLFAEGFGYALQRTALQERLRSARDQVQKMTRGMAHAMDSMCTTGASFGPESPGGFDLSDQPAVAASLVVPQSQIEDLLSRREIQVLSLMATGKSNGEIANSLVISEGTVKSHVKHILRKLRAANRAEAVFRFMRMSAAERGPQPR